MLLNPSGGGAINLITNGNADSVAASIFTPYADGTAYPVDGAGGSPTVTSSVTSTNPLTGTKSYLLTKPASAATGNGWSTGPITLDPAYRAKTLQISFDYIFTDINTNTWNDGSMIWVCYDITNSKIVEPSNTKMFSESTTVSDKFQATVQFDSNCTSFRLLGHMTNTYGASAELKIDNVTISPSVNVYGTPITDWQAYTPTFVGLGTVTAIAMQWRRVGSSMEVLGTFNCGTVTGATAYFNLPNNIQSALGIGTGVGQYGTQGGAGSGGVLVWNPADNKIYFGGSNWQVLQAGTALATGGINTVQLSIPIQGWGASVQVSDSYDSRTIAFSEYQSASQLIPNAADTEIINYDAASVRTVDTVASFNRTTGRYTILSSGYYRINAILHWVNNATGYRVVSIAKNGSIHSYGTITQAVSSGDGTAVVADAIIKCVAGDTISMFGYQTSGASLNTRALAGTTKLSIEKMQGPQAIAANEKIAFKYRTSAGSTINNTFPTITYATKVYDTHGIYSGGSATIPRAGFYSLSGAFQSVGRVSTIDFITVMVPYINGVASDYIAIDGDQTVTGRRASATGSTTLYLNAGDVITFRVYSDVTTTLSVVPQCNYISLESI